MGYRAILLDLDNTLYPYDKAHSPALDRTIKKISEIFSVSIEDINDAYYKGRKQVHIEHPGTASSHNRLLYFQRLFELLNINPINNALEAYNTYWDTFIDNMKPYSGVYDFLEQANKNKIQICLITDLTAHIQHRKISALKLNKYTNFLVTSEEAGREKPHPYIFLMALNKIQMTPSETAMIGDNYEKDILGAANLGIMSYWLTDDINDPNPVLNNLIKKFTSFENLIGYFS